MAKAMGLIFLLFDIASVPFTIPMYVLGIIHGLTSASFMQHPSLLTAKSVNLVEGV